MSSLWLAIWQQNKSRSEQRINHKIITAFRFFLPIKNPMQKHRAKNRGTTYIYAKMRLVKLSRAYPTNPTPFRNAAPKWTSLCPPSNALSRRRLLCKWPTKLLSFSSLFILYIIYHSKKNKSNKKQNKKVKQPQFHISKDKTNCLKTKTKYFNLPNIFVENKTNF